MPTPLTAYTVSMSRALSLLEASRALTGLAPVMGAAPRPTVADDLLRAAVVLAVSALDGYVHHCFSTRFVPYVRNNPIAMTAGQSLYDYLRQIGVPAGTLVLPPAVKGKRPLAKLRSAVDDRLFKRPLQKVEEIERALEAVGLPTAILDLSAAAGISASTLRSRITRPTVRRNAIAHEGDLFRGKKKRFVTRPITDAEVAGWLTRIDDFARRLDSYIAAHPP